MGKPEKHVQGNKSQKNAARACHLQYVIIILVFLLSVSISSKWRLAFIQDRSQARYGANEQLLVAGAVPKLPPKVIFSSFFLRRNHCFFMRDASLVGGDLRTGQRVQHWCCALPNIAVSLCLSALLSVILHIVLGLVHQKSQIYLQFEELS